MPLHRATARDGIKFQAQDLGGARIQGVVDSLSYGISRFCAEVECYCDEQEIKIELFGRPDGWRM